MSWGKGMKGKTRGGHTWNKYLTAAMATVVTSKSDNFKGGQLEVALTIRYEPSLASRAIVLLG